MLSKFKVSIRGEESQVVVYDPSEEPGVALKELGALHHIHVIDRSGSMSDSLDGLIDDVQNIFHHIDEDDYLTVIWFSSENQFRTVVKAARKTENIKKLLDSLRTTVGSTCFSDPMKEVGLVVEETYPLCPNIVVTLFTDGQPCCSRGADEEMRLTLGAVSKFSDKVMAVNTVGYGNYYDQEFLKKISAKSQYGVMTHTRDIGNYFKIFQENVDAVSGMVNKKTEVKSPGSTIIYLGPNSCKAEESEMFQRQRSKNKNLYFIVNPKSLEIDGVRQDLTKVKGTTDGDMVLDFIYAQSYVYYYNNERRKSLIWLAEGARDKTLVDQMVNAFTFDETSAVMEGLKKALFKGVRNDGSCPRDYLPADDAPCVLQLVSLLADAGAKYIPYSNKVEGYKRIGKKTEETYSTFHRYEFKIPKGDFSDLVYNDERLNVSIKFTVSGYVQLNPASAKRVGLPEQIPTEIFRNHTLIKDGQINLKSVEVEIPELTPELMKFVKMGVITESGDTYIVDFHKIPVINYRMVQSASVDKIFQSIKKISHLEAYQKTLKYHHDTLVETMGDEVKRDGLFATLTPEQIQVLEEHGLSEKGWYKGFPAPAPKAEESDFYEARLMKFYLKGVTSLPSVNKFLEAKGKKKVNTPSLMLMEGAWGETESLIGQKKSPEVSLKTLSTEMTKTKKKLNAERMFVNGVKISKALTNDWFPGLKMDDKGNYVYQQGDDTLVLRADRTNVYFTAGD